MTNQIYVIDIGNSHAKIAKVMSDANVKLVATLPLCELPRGVNSHFQGEKITVILAGTAHPDLIFQTAEGLRKPDTQVLILEKTGHLPFRSQYVPGEAGIDRLANVAAAYSKVATACIVVDAGTAITVEVIANDGAFLGGFIYPGLQLQSEALSRGTASLPQIDPTSVHTEIGTSTAEAIGAGIIYGTVGAVDRFLLQATSVLGNPDPPVILTGGSSLFLLDALGERVRHQPDLTLLGLYLLARHQFPDRF